VFHLKFPYAPFFNIMRSTRASFYVMPKEGFGAGGGGMDRATQVIGTGPRQLVSYQPAVSREYRRHEQFWMTGKPYLARWHVPIMPEYASRYAQFVTGNLHAFTPNATDVLTLRQDAPSANVFQTEPGTGLRFVEFGLKDFERQPYRDERVRQAMSMSVDWDAMRAHFDNSAEFEAAGLPVEARRHTHVKAGGDAYDYWLDPKKRELGENSKYLLFDLAEARKLMSAAGYPNGIQLNGYMNAGTEYGTTEYPTVIQITVDQWASSGLFRVNVNRQPYAVHLEDITRVRMYEGVNIQQPQFVYVDIDLELFNFYHRQGSRFKALPDPVVEDMVTRQRRETDPERRATIIHDIQKHMAKTMAVVPGDGVSSGFTFRSQYLRNIAWPEWNWWISPDAPRRDG
jgi:peptide/nickel transport system substrate-binding protein